MTLEEAISATVNYIKFLAHDSTLYDKEDIVQEGYIAVWQGLEKVKTSFTRGQKISFLKRCIAWRINNFIMSNLVDVKIGRTKLRKLKKSGVDIIGKYRAYRCSNFNGYKSKYLGPYHQTCFNEGLRNVKNKNEISKYIQWSL